MVVWLHEEVGVYRDVQQKILNGQLYELSRSLCFWACMTIKETYISWWTTKKITQTLSILLSVLKFLMFKPQQHQNSQDELGYQFELYKEIKNYLIDDNHINYVNPISPHLFFFHFLSFLSSYLAQQHRRGGEPIPFPAIFFNPTLEKGKTSFSLGHFKRVSFPSLLLNQESILMIVRWWLCMRSHNVF